MKTVKVTDKSKDKCEKLIVRLVEDLLDVVDIFARLNRDKDMKPEEEIHIVLNSVHAFYNEIMNKICDGIKDHAQVNFLEECDRLHDLYMKKLKEDYASNTGKEQSAEAKRSEGN